MSMIVFTHNNMELEYHSELKMVEIRWVGAFHIEDLALLWLKGVAAINKYDIETVLIDATHITVENDISINEDEVKQYFSENLPIPSVKKVARVCAGSPLYDARMAQLYQKLLSQNNPDSEFANFQHHYEALDWLTGDKNQNL